MTTAKGHAPPGASSGSVLRHQGTGRSRTWSADVRRVLSLHPGGRFEALDGCRAVAALGVVVYHVAGWAQLTSGDGLVSRFLNNLGNFGVAVFFLLSGFLLYRPFVLKWFRDEAPPDLMVFIRHRLLRIFPAYFVALTAFIVLGLIRKPDPPPDYYLSLFSLIQIYRPRMALEGLGVAWTLAIELSFYLMLPFIAAAIRQIGRKASSLRMKLEAQLLGLGALVILAFVYRATIVGPGLETRKVYAIQLWLPNFLDWFALGMLLAVCICWIDMGKELPRIVRQVANRGWLCWSLAAVCYFALMMSRDGSRAGLLAFRAGPETTGQMFLRFALNGLAAFFLLLPLVLGRRPDMLVKRSLSGLAVVYLGAISYGIYLWHMVWLNLLESGRNEVGQRSFWIMLCVVLALTLPTASISYFWIERPITRRRDFRLRLPGRACTNVDRA